MTDAIAAPADAPTPIRRAVQPTGLSALDHYLGGGLSAGLVGIRGPESGGKSALAHLILAAAQRQGKRCAAVGDASFSSARAALAGVDVPQLLVLECFTSPFEALELLMQQGDVQVVLLDPLTALFGPGAVALTSGPVRRLSVELERRGIICLFTVEDSALERLGATPAEHVSREHPQPLQAARRLIAHSNRVLRINARGEIGVMRPSDLTGGRYARSWAEARPGVRLEIEPDAIEPRESAARFVHCAIEDGLVHEIAVPSVS